MKKNRAIILRLNDAACYLAHQEIPFRDDDSSTSLNKGVEDLNVLKSHGPLLENNLISVTSFKIQMSCLFHEIFNARIQITVKKIA